MASNKQPVSIFLYEPIDSYDGMSAKRFRDELAKAGDAEVLHLHLNSPGGSIFEGLAIYNLLKQHAAKKIVFVDGFALSMASVVAMAGDEIEVAENGFLMIHNPINVAIGDSDDMRSVADLLDKLKAQLVAIYVKRTGRTAEEISSWMDAETWMNAEEAIANGFADRAGPELAVAATIDLTRFSNVPSSLNKERTMPETSNASETKSQAAPVAATIEQIEASCAGADPAFCVAQIKAKATVEQAQAAWLAEMQKRLDAANQKAADATAKAAELEAAAKGHGESKGAGYVKTERSSGSSGGGQGTAMAAWNAAISAKMAAGMSRSRAASAVASEQPDLRQAMLDEVNPSK